MHFALCSQEVQQVEPIHQRSQEIVLASDYSAAHERELQQIPDYSAAPKRALQQIPHYSAAHESVLQQIADVSAAQDRVQTPDCSSTHESVLQHKHPARSQEMSRCDHEDTIHQHGRATSRAAPGVCTCTHIYLCVYMYTYMYMHICEYISIYLYIYIYAYLNVCIFCIHKLHPRRAVLIVYAFVYCTLCKQVPSCMYV